MSGTSPIPQRPAGHELPPGPRGSLIPTMQFQRAPLKFLARMLDKYGDIFFVDLIGMPTIVLNDPTYVDHVLKRNHSNYDRRGPAVDIARKFFGNGLGTAARPEWLGQRRMLQPSFHRQRIAEFSESMTSVIEATLDRWEQMQTVGSTIDVGAEMTDVTLRIVLKSLFDCNMADNTLRRFTESVTIATQELASFMRFPLVPLSVPTTGHRRFHRALKELDAITYEMISRHRTDASSHHSLLSKMMTAEDPQTHDGMTDDQLRDEVLTMLFAGHETSANTLTWIWHLLGAHPDVESRLRTEIDSVLEGRRPTMQDLPRLEYTRQVIAEALRLYSPAWHNYRQALEDDEIDGYHIPAGTTIFWSYYFIHRHRSYWPDPEQFDPDRFSGIDRANPHNPAYYPFGSGPRLCIGNIFAMVEMQFMIAMALQRFRLVSTSTTPADPVPTLTLVPSRPVTARLEQYGSTSAGAQSG
ncbi:cytochrome P450 [Nocardia sp. NPDC004573]